MGGSAVSVAFGVLTAGVAFFGTVPQRQAAAAHDPRSLGLRESEIRELLPEFGECNAMASARMLSLDEAVGCSQTYLRLKLVFVEGVDIESYRGLDASSRAEVNMEAYALFTEWRALSAAGRPVTSTGAHRPDPRLTP